MLRFFKTVIPLLAASLLFQSADAKPELPMDPDHVELRALGESLVKAISAGDMDAIEPLLHPNVVVTWQDGQVCKGPAQVRKFYEAMAAKSKKTFQGYKVPPTADEPTILYSGATTGVAYGHNVGIFHLAGKDFEMPNRWTATMVKENGKWLLSSYHVSMNVLDNPLLNAVKCAALIGSVLALLVGLIVGLRIGRKRKVSA